MERLAGQAEDEAKRWMAEAVNVAARAMCLKAKCGTVIVKDGQVIGEGYNAPPLDREENRTCDQEYRPGKRAYDKTCCIHAEWRAIMDALKRYPDKVAGSKLYFMRIAGDGTKKMSGQPYCTVCSRLALDAGIGHFLLWQEEGIAEYGTTEYNQLSYEYTPVN